MKLFIIHVGYYDHEIGMYELHSQFFLVANTAAEAKANAMTKDIFKAKKMHIDGIQELNYVDGYTVSLQSTDQQDINKIYSYNEIREL